MVVGVRLFSEIANLPSDTGAPAISGVTCQSTLRYDRCREDHRVLRSHFTLFWRLSRRMGYACDANSADNSLR